MSHVRKFNYIFGKVWWIFEGLVEGQNIFYGLYGKLFQFIFQNFMEMAD
jgi:hypothetical protein